MQKKTFVRGGLVVLTVAVLSACSSMQQQPSPIETGNSGSTPISGVGGDYVDNNPYGTSQIGGTTPPPTTTVTYPAAGSTVGGYVASYAPVDVNAMTHTVVAGDTVYNITKRYHINQNNLYEWNGLSDNNIRIGQVLRVKPSGYIAPAMGNTNVSVQPPVAVTTTTPVTTTTATTASGATRVVDGITWMRPTAGTVITPFNATSKGIDISGQMGQAIVAVADGKVVYSGSDPSMKYFGNLIIVQHNQNYLSAYANNKNVLLKSGDSVKRGQTIAYMGNSGTDKVKLHFEIRQQGTPVDPSKYLPM